MQRSTWCHVYLLTIKNAYISIRGLDSFQVQKIFLTQMFWALLVWREQSSHLMIMFTKQPYQPSLFSKWSDSFCSGTRNLQVFQNIFAWRFLSANISTLSFMSHCVGSERCSYKTVFFLFSLGVYLEPAEHPFLWLSDSCQSQVDLVLWRVAEPYLDSNWVDFVGRGQMFDSSAPVLYGVSKWFVLHMSAKEKR